MLSLFTTLAVLLRAICEEITAHSGVLRIHLGDVRYRDAYFAGCQKLDVAEAESHGVAAAVELGIVQL
jgi:hypothetical protein